MEKITYSIIIIVKNDHGIALTLNSISKQVDFNSTEIIVVDGSNGKLDQIKKDHTDIRWIAFNSPKIKKITIPEQRNIGLKEAKGSILIFIDASCTPGDNWFAEITKYIVSGEEKIVAGSVWGLPPNKHHDARNVLLSNMEYLQEAPTINLAMNKSVIDKVGLFDESFDYGSDVDFTMRAIKEGYKIRYNNKAVITHDWGSLSDDFKRAFRYGIARVNIYIKHRDKLTNLVTSDYITLLYPIFIITLPLIFIQPLYALIILIPLIKNYKYKPFYTTSYNMVYGAGIIYNLMKSLL